MAEATTSRKRKAEGAAPAKKAATPRRKPAATAARRDGVAHDAIARRAYELHLAGNGDPLLNWLTAEQELLRDAG